MLKRWMILLLTLMLLSTTALAEVYAGTTVALMTVPVVAETGGTVESIDVRAGQLIEAGETLARLKPEKTYATQDGTISTVSADVGDAVDGTVLELMPVERYTVYCTVDKAYQSASATLVHSGETLCIKCTADGTHRAVGIVTQIEGDEYRVVAIGGELYVGETVYLYRDEAFSTAQRVGIGTVVVSDTEAYSGEGTLTQINVSAGQYVERGQLLYATGGGAITADAGGILTGVSCQIGEAVSKGQTLAELVPGDAICVEIQVDETAVAAMSIGDAAQLIYPGQDEDAPVRGTIVAISKIADAQAYAVRILPEGDVVAALGMSVEVRID